MAAANQARELVETVCVNKSGASLFTVLILGLLKAKELAPAAAVCRKWRRMAVDDSLWEKFCKPYPMLAVKNRSPFSWLLIYQRHWGRETQEPRRSRQKN